MKYPSKIEYIGRFEHYSNKEEGEYWVITFPDVSGCVTQGYTFKEAVEMAKEALALILTVYVDNKEKFPEAKFKLRKITKRTKTKKIVLTLDEIMKCL